MVSLIPALILCLSLQTAQAPAASEVDPAIQAVVRRFFETQQAEDVQGYLALWSATATRPQAAQLRFIFEAGDDLFSDITIVSATITGNTARVRVTATRQRTDLQAKRPDGKPRVFTTRMQQALALVREGDAWKIVREGPPADELAAALIETEDPELREAILASEPALVNARLVDAISRRADALAQVQKYKDAQAVYERSLEVAQAIGDRKLEGRALQNVANALYFQRDFSRALTLYQRRLDLERDIENGEGIASALLGVATIQYSQFEYGAALQSYREALGIQETLGDEVQVSTTLISTGNVLYLQGDYDGAIADYRRAEEIKRRYFDTAGAATALEGLGRVYSAQGDYAAALLAFTGVLHERRARSDAAGQALALQGIGEIHFRLGNTEQARAAFEESRTSYESIKDVGSAGRVWQGTAVNELAAGRFPDAEKAYASSIKLCTAADDGECIARAQVGLAFALAAQQKYGEAIAWYQQSILSFDALKMTDPSARAKIGLAEALAGSKEYIDALNQASLAGKMGVELQSDDLLWRALVSQARAERKLGRPADALATARAAVLAVERMAAEALDRPGQAVPRDTSAAYATLAVLQAEAGDARGAFTTAEAMRTHRLRSDLAANERDIARGMSEAERAEERAFAAELTTLFVRRDREKALPKPDAARIEKLESAVEDAIGRRNAWRAGLFTRLPELEIWRGLAPPATADDLTRLLDA
ncbi:MAG TPA: tetratricopeptide repeat protein, partial [Vicinamibacterales bacterium]